jgi:probable F420-dependent oxidoreductase
MVGMDKFGLDVGIYGVLAQPETILRLTAFAEKTGFDAIWLADHVAFPVAVRSQYPYSAQGAFPVPLSDPLLEPIATMGVLIGASRRIRIGTAVLIMGYRNPLLLARMLVTLDQFSGGRIILGAGVGWLEEEFEVLGNAQFKRRGKVTDEALEIFKAVCAGGEVGYKGETYAFAPVYSNPGSLQRPHPPILIGGLTDPALRRVARLGAGWLAVTASPDKLRERLTLLKRFAAEAGRAFEDLALYYKIFLNIGEAKRSRFDAREPGTGSIDDIIEDLRKLFDLGFQKIIVRCRASSGEELTRQIDRFASDIVARI